MITKGIKTRIFNFLHSITGKSAGFGLEGRIFHTFCFTAIVAALLSFFINISIGLTIPSRVSLAIFFAQGILYYISRFKRKLNLAIIISSIEVNALLYLNYFFNSGIKGPGLLLFSIVLFFAVSVGKVRTIFFWLCFNIVVVSSLIIIEYYHPDLILDNYTQRGDYFFDILFSYIIVAALIYIGVSYLRTSYLKQKNKASEKTEALAKLNTEKDKLFSIISHDLRTPLANVQQYLEMLAVVDLSSEEKMTLEKDLLNITRNAQELLTNLLEWSRNQMEGVRVNQQSFNLETEISKTVNHMNVLAAKKDLELLVSIEKNCKVFADPDMLNLIIRNLLHNAIKFTPPGGVVEISAKSNQNGCIIYVKDTGKGIPLNQQQDIFSLKVVTTFGTNKEKGTGIGLMLCKEYVEMQNGKIWFETKENAGTTFYLSFPNEETIQNQG